MSSAVVTQSLTMLNDAFVLEQTGYFAARVAREAGPAPAKRVRRAFLLALCAPLRPLKRRAVSNFWGGRQSVSGAAAPRTGPSSNCATCC